MSKIARKQDDQVLSVGQLNRLAKQLLEDHFPAVHVQGEISNLSQPASGHWYFTLKDQQAQVRCAMFVIATCSCAANHAMACRWW